MSNNFQAADRALQLLECFRADKRELRVADVAVQLGIHRSTASRLAATLAKRNFLERVPGGKTFRLGQRMSHLGLLALGSHDLLAVARPVMDRLAEKTGEAVNLATRDGNEVVHVLQVEGRHLLGAGVWTGRRTPMHCVANGKVLLAFGDGDVSGTLKRCTRRTITRVTKLQVVLHEVRRNGWAHNEGEIEEALNAVAAPVFDSSKRCSAAISIDGPFYRMPPEQFPRLGRLCVAAAREISGQLRGV
jgi:DNA-binding IclR family transcriptional regulator